MQKQMYVFEMLPITDVHPDGNQPRKVTVKEEEHAQLVASIQTYGIEMPLSVVQNEERKYDIIDGHRRYFAAKKVGLSYVPCRVYQKMPEGELESRRYEIQNNRKSWKPLERAQVLKRIRECLKLKNNKDLSAHLHVSETLVANALQLMGLKYEYLEMMAGYGLAESYQTEFMRLKPKMRRIKDLEVDEIIERIFKKVQDNVITNSREFRKLGSLFKRATANEDALHAFLTDPDHNVKNLGRKTSSSGVSLYAEDLQHEIVERLQKGGVFDAQEIGTLTQLAALIRDKVLSQ